MVVGDRNKLIDYTGPGGETLSLTAAATLGAGLEFHVRNSGGGTLTIDPSGAELIDGLATVGISPNQAIVIVCTGTAFKITQARGYGAGTGDVVGPASSTNRALALFDGTTGKLVKNGPALGSSGQVLMSQGSGADPIFSDFTGKGYLGVSGPQPVYTSASTVTIKAGLKIWDDTGAHLMIVGSDIPVVLSASGAAGLDTGAEGSNTHYYYWICEGPSGVTCVASTSSTSPTLPAGYNTWKRRLNISVKNDGSSNIIPFTVADGWPYCTKMEYDVYLPGSCAAATTNVLALGAAQTTFATLSLASFVPPISKKAWLHTAYQNGTAGSAANIRPNGASHNGYEQYPRPSAYQGTHLFPMPTNSSQEVQYYQGSLGNFYVYVAGYVITEVA